MIVTLIDLAGFSKTFHHAELTPRIVAFDHSDRRIEFALYSVEHRTDGSGRPISATYRQLPSFTNLAALLVPEVSE